MNSPEVGQEQAAPQEPFVIRGHHLRSVLGLYTIAPPDELARRTYQSAAQDECHFTEEGLPYGYYPDVYGVTEEQADSVLKSEAQFYTDFLALPDEYPVRLVADQKDGICDGCIIGKHCELKNGLLEGNAIGDQAFIRAFSQVAGELNLRETLSEQQATATYSNGKPRQVTDIITPAATVKKVIQDEKFRKKVNAISAKSIRLRRRLDNLAPERFIENNRGIRRNFARLRPLAAAFTLVAASSGIFHAGEATQLYSQDNEAPLLSNSDIEISDELEEKLSEVWVDALKAAVGGLVWTKLPKRRKLKQ